MIERKVPVVNPQYAVEKFDNEILLYTLSGTKIITLDETAYLVWQLCHESLMIGEIIDVLVQLYPEQEKQIRDDVLDTVKEMAANTIIELIDEK